MRAYALKWLPVALIALGAVGLASSPFWLMARGIWAGHQRVKHLLLDVDFETLLRACDDLSKRVTEGKLEPRQYIVRGDPDPEALSFPQPILDLDPVCVIVTEAGVVRIELYGSWHQYGAQAVPPDYAGPPLGDAQLIPRLWFYDDHYDRDPGCREGIAALMERRRSEKAGNRE